MEPIKHPQTARLRSLKMYREDLDLLLEFFESKCVRTAISDKRYRYESFDEMKKNSGSRIYNLEIHGEQPGLHFLVNQEAQVKAADNSVTTIIFNELRAREATEEADALFFRVKDFLSARQQPQVRKRFVALAVVAFSGSLLFVIRNQPAAHVAPFTRLSFAVLLVGVSISVASLLLACRIGNYLTLETSLDSPSFWARHQDAFATHAVTATISAVIGGIVGWLVGHFLK
jgi:hypothetical protein